MNAMKRYSISTEADTILLILSGCAGMSAQDRDTGYGAAAGGVAGALLTGGVLGILGGAAVGGLIGREIGEENEKKD